MIKAKDIKNIKKEYSEYKELLKYECDLIKRLKYEMKLRDLEWKLHDVEVQLFNIEYEFIGNSKLYVSLFRDRYINNIPVRNLVHKYSMSEGNIYRILNKAKRVFESKTDYNLTF
ncbi:hypothetical protein [Caproiciproducens sp. MSJ-32]|uniref:hypothetical protein n=1 Tax=Caproiciproducens sp. MSJ-32 TaxID=2841527 RepID=UPI001C102DA4|nr:hypothetical protein [Caproiciproducens sp. MSJ-32]MBU5455406.1 hypothetical protein [Caproiciproducens sp. MSJ-32]